MIKTFFRGKTLKGEWFYGDLNHFDKGTKIVISDEGVLLAEVIPETVGQYTGLKDKNGTKIFEGDIVKWRFQRIWETDYHTSKVIWDYFMSGWRLTVQGGNAKMRKDIEYEILGNMHDNPELLEVE